jgi:AcrR family transcriptional regulator
MLANMPRPPKARAPLKHAALDLFVTRGVHAAGIRDIAKHAGCSEAALYRHWASKEDLVANLFREHLAEVRVALEAAIGGETTLDGQARAACAACYRLYDEQPLVFRFVMLVQHELAKDLPPELRMPQDIITDMIAAAVKRGEAAGDPVLLAAAVIGIFLETATFVIYGRLPGPLTAYIEPVTASALRVLRS